MEYNAADIIGRLEALRNTKLSSPEKQSIEDWEKGRNLAITVGTSGWDVAVELLTGYVIRSLEDLAKTDPKDKDEVLAAHSVTFVASNLLRIFKQDVNTWIESSRKTPTVVKETLDSQASLQL